MSFRVRGEETEPGCQRNSASKMRRRQSTAGRSRTLHFMPFLLRARHVAPGVRVLDVVGGTGLSAEAALAAVGPTGHVTGADISPAMVGNARERLGKVPNVSVSVEDGQALSFSDESRCDTVRSRTDVLSRPHSGPVGNSPCA